MISDSFKPENSASPQAWQQWATRSSVPTKVAPAVAQPLTPQVNRPPQVLFSEGGSANSAVNFTQDNTLAPRQQQNLTATTTPAATPALPRQQSQIARAMMAPQAANTSPSWGAPAAANLPPAQLGPINAQLSTETQGRNDNFMQWLSIPL